MADPGPGVVDNPRGSARHPGPERAKPGPAEEQCLASVATAGRERPNPTVEHLVVGDWAYVGSPLGMGQADSASLFSTPWA
jgi:hypothetical protein